MKGTNKSKNTKRNKNVIWLSVVMTIFFLLFIIFLLLNQTPTAKLVTDTEGDKTLIGSKLELRFNRPIQRQAEVSITPEVYGQTTYSQALWGDHLVRSIAFEPELTWQPGTTYEVRVSNIKGSFLSIRKPAEQVFVFTAQDKPEVTGIIPEAGETIAPTQSFTLSLTASNENLRNFDFQFQPTLEFTKEYNEEKNQLTITPTKKLSQGQEYQLSVTGQDIRYYFGTDAVAYQGEPVAEKEYMFTVRQAPGVAAMQPQGTMVALDKQISVTFSENVDFESFKKNAEIKPALEGSWVTEDYKTITYDAAALQKDTTYTLILQAGLETFNGGYLEENAQYSFTTIGPAKVISSFPHDTAQGVSVNSGIRWQFNQAVDHASAEGKFTISPEVNGTFSWQENEMTFQPDGQLSFNQTYAVAMSAGVTSQQGYASEQAYNFSFTTEASVTKLAVPFHRQEHNLSCEIATLVMALSFYNIDVSESTLIQAMGFDPTPKQDGVWGNPHIAFVGDIDGHQPSTGYGVYWQPIAQVAKAYRDAEWFTGWSVEQLTEAIKDGYPVIIWGTAGSGSRIDWQTPQGGTVIAVNGEHTRVAIGFIGPADNPSKIITLDPLSGEKYFTIDSFRWNWGLLGNSGVVVR